ncbi:MAG TPA: NAD-dependent epimerase/dehydratase family protein, partial [Saprospiraceae bacterium]|nr:NAD-dependent epimerase/dehydratase family protein [Saprospiraceae bacterium]
MKVLFIGGTGNISTPVSEMAIHRGLDVHHLNRGNKPTINGVKTILADYNNFEQTKQALAQHQWDVVVNWIAFTPDEIEKDLVLFSDNCKQYIFISSASCYSKPPGHPIITESTPLKNPHWQYSRDKIACEELLVKAHRERDFPMTIVRPSHTYYSIFPLTIGGWIEYTALDRIKKGKPIVIQGDGTSLWTVTHAYDFAKGFLGLLGNVLAIGESFHITSDEALSWNQIYQQMAAAVGCEAKIVHVTTHDIIKFARATGYEDQEGGLWGDKSHCAIFDNSKIKRFVPDFVATIPFAQGIKQTIEWFEADPSRMLIKE